MKRVQTTFGNAYLGGEDLLRSLKGSYFKASKSLFSTQP